MSSEQNPTIINAGITSSGTYTVTVTNSGGCSATSTTSLTVNPLPALSVSGNPICQGQTRQLTANASGVSYAWNTGATTQSINVNDGNTYSITITDKYGCQNSDTIKVFQIPVPKLNLGKDTIICPGTELILNPHNDTVSYTWNDNSHNNTLEVNKSGKYSLTVTDKYGCTNSDSITVSQSPKSDLNIGTLCNNCSFTLHAGNKFKYYKWQDGSKDSIYTVKTNGTYRVTVTDKYGCENRDSIIVIDECEVQDLYIPNAFTPNGDNINDIFKVDTNNLKCFTDFNMKIFNRWGDLLYETNDINKGWDGKFKNKNVPEGVYVYIITYYNINNSSSKLSKKGTITVLR